MHSPWANPLPRGTSSGRRRTRPSLTWLVAVPVIGSSVGCAAGGSGLASPAEPVLSSLLYVCVQDAARIAIVDMASLDLVGTVSLADFGFGPNAMPHDIAVEADGSHWFVSLIGENRVLRMNGRNELVGQVALGTPGMVDVAPGGDLLVTRSMSAVNPPPRIGIVSGATWTARELDVLFPRPHGIAVDRAGRYAYTASLGQNRMASIDLATDRVELVDVAGPVHALVQFAISPDGRTMVASGELSGELVVFSLEDPARPRPLTSVALGAQPFDPVFSPDGSTVWVPLKGANEVVIVDTAEWQVASRITGDRIRQPHAIAFSPDGSRAFVTNNDKDAHAMHEPPAGTAVGGGGGASAGGDGTGGPPVPEASLVVIDVRTRRVETAIPLGPNLTGLGSRSVR